MAWDYVAQSGPTADATGNLTLVEPTGAAQGDLLVACLAMRSTAVVTVPDGWATVATQQNSGDTDGTDGIASGLMAWIVRGASAPSYAFTRTAGDIVLARVICYRGNHATPYDTGSANTLAVGSTTGTTGTFSTAEANELIVAMHAGGDNDAASTFDATDPGTASGATDTTTEPTAGTWIQRAASGTNTGADTYLAIADAIRATAGATGTIQSTSVGSGRSVMIAGAFKIAAKAKTITADAGSYAVTGTNASLELGREVAATAGSYAITGTDAALSRGIPITADAGSYAVTGTDASLEIGREVVGDAGSYAITGSAATLAKTIPITADAGSYALTGSAATLSATRILDATAGSYAITGTSASLEYGYVISAAPGSYAITGTDVTLTYDGGGEPPAAPPSKLVTLMIMDGSSYGLL